MSKRKHAVVLKECKPISHPHDDTSRTIAHVEQARREFARIVSPGDGGLAGGLDEAALLIAHAFDPHVEIEEQMTRLDVLADGLSAATTADLAIELFGGVAHDPQVHFAGNSANYYDMDNSLLHRVLDRRCGIPITLSLVCIEVGRRRGLTLHGVGMPGHFLVGSDDGYIDTFHGGNLLDTAGCTALYQRLAGTAVELPNGALAPTPPAHIVKRILVNLAAIVTNTQERRQARAVWALLAAFPDADHRAHLRHAFAAAEIGQFDEAAAAGDRALADPALRADDRVRSQIEQWRSRLN